MQEDEMNRKERLEQKRTIKLAIEERKLEYVVITNYPDMNPVIMYMGQ
jgi:hypothetical protein